MILFLEDWEKYPEARPDYDTSNKSFIRICGIFKQMGIKNHLFPLALHNQLLKGVDPFDPDLDTKTIIMIVTECKINPWYYFREVVRVPVTGSPEPVKLEANRGNISLFWLFFNHITVLLIQCRQTGKSLSTDVLMNLIRCILCMNTEMQLVTKNDNLRNKNIARLKALQSQLPYYLNLKTRQDADNNEKLTCVSLGNTYYTAVGQPSEEGARKVGRGLTLAINHIDEIAFVANIEILLKAMLAGTGAARENAKINNSPYGNIFTTTAGYLSSASGRYVYENIYKKCFLWSEKLFDCKNEEDLVDVIKRNTPGGRVQVLCEYSHRQLGKTDNWLRERILEAMSDGEDAEADFLNIWATGNVSSPLSKETLERLDKGMVREPYVDIRSNGYVINWYISPDAIPVYRERVLVMGMDTSEAIGNDDITMYIMDVESGAAVATGVYNETNVITFSNWLAEFLIEFKKTILVIEKRSTGITIIDNLILILLAKNIDPFKRIFNFCVNDSDEKKEFQENIIDTHFAFRDERVYTMYRKYFGYATSGAGRTSRDNLYGSGLKACSKYLASVAKDKTLITQLKELVVKNGRIDHVAGGHDDMVIAWLLCYWFLTNGKKLQFYGINPKSILEIINTEMIKEQGGVERIAHREKQLQIKHYIESLAEMLKNERNQFKSAAIIAKMRQMYKELDEDYTNNFNIDNLLDEIKNNRLRR